MVAQRWVWLDARSFEFCANPVAVNSINEGTQWRVVGATVHNAYESGAQYSRGDAKATRFSARYPNEIVGALCQDGARDVLIIVRTRLWPEEHAGNHEFSLNTDSAGQRCSAGIPSFAWIAFASPAFIPKAEASSTRYSASWRLSRSTPNTETA